MMDNAKAAWAGLTTREQKLVALAALLALGVIFWLLMRPALALGMDVSGAHQAAVEREGRVAAKAALLRLPASAAPSVGGTLAGGAEQYFAQSASEIGLSLSRNEQRGKALHIAIADGKAPVVMHWIAGLEAQGFIVDALTITPQADGSAALTADLHRAQP